MARSTELDPREVANPNHEPEYGLQTYNSANGMTTRELQELQDYTTENLFQKIQVDFYAGVSQLRLTQEEQDQLMEPVREEDVCIRPDGLIYLPQTQYRARLNKIIGIGQWSIIELNVAINKDEQKCFFRGALIIRKKFVSLAIGESSYHVSNANESYATAYESAKSDCLTRCCKDLSVASELWDPNFTRSWIKQWAVKYMATVRKWDFKGRKHYWKDEPRWRRIDDIPEDSDLVRELGILPDSPNKPEGQKLYTPPAQTPPGGAQTPKSTPPSSYRHAQEDPRNAPQSSAPQNKPSNGTGRVDPPSASEGRKTASNAKAPIDEFREKQRADFQQLREDLATLPDLPSYLDWFQVNYAKINSLGRELRNQIIPMCKAREKELEKSEGAGAEFIPASGKPRPENSQYDQTGDLDFKNPMYGQLEAAVYNCKSISSLESTFEEITKRRGGTVPEGWFKRLEVAYSAKRLELEKKTREFDQTR